MKNISDYLPRNITLDNKIYILANELLKSLKNFADSCDGVSLYLEIEKELKIISKKIATNFLSQNIIRPLHLHFHTVLLLLQIQNIFQLYNIKVFHL